MKYYYLIPVIICLFIISDQLTDINDSIKQLQVNIAKGMNK